MNGPEFQIGSWVEPFDEGVPGIGLPLQRPDHATWCRNLVDAMKEGAVWGIPRSGLLLRKTSADGLELIAREPGPPELRAVQDQEMRSLREHFQAAGVTIVDNTSDYHVTVVEEMPGHHPGCDGNCGG
jgi:hypothetical protein